VKGVPQTPEQANARIDRWRGTKGTSDAVVQFTREAVRDAMCAAPQPVTIAWLAYSTVVVGKLARTAEAQGRPLTREGLFSRARIDRFLSVDCADMVTQARSGYRSRLDVIAGALLHGQVVTAWPRATMSDHKDNLTPWGLAQAARVTLWTTGLRPATRRLRMRTLCGTTLGGGLRRRDVVLVTGEMVRVNDLGVHMTVPATDAEPSRIVTVARAWEQTIVDAAAVAGSNLLIAPDRSSLSVDTLTRTIDTANQTAPVGDEFVIGRARNTWLLRHLAAGTPLNVLMPQAGLTTTAHLQDLLPFLPIIDPAGEAAASRMRDLTL